MSDPVDNTHAARLVGLQAPSVVLPWTTYAACHDQLGPAANTSLAAISEWVTLVVYFFSAENEGTYDANTMSRAFRDADDAIGNLKVRTVGVSTQTTHEQQTIATIELFPQLLLADEDMALAEALDLPTLQVNGRNEYEPLTVIIRNGYIAHVIHPIVSPREHIAKVLDWLTQNAISDSAVTMCDRRYPGHTSSHHGGRVELLSLSVVPCCMQSLLPI